MKKFGILKEHNYIPYEQIEEKFSQGATRVGFVQATGTGKAFIAIKWLSEHCMQDSTKRGLVLTSQKPIADQFRGYMDDLRLTPPYFFDNVDIATYSSLLQLKDEDFDAMDYDYIVLDEFHRVGASKWGECVKKLLSINPNIEVLGTTATPVRFLDSQRDMGYELFGEDLVVGPDLNESIRTGILPTPRYVTAIYRYDDVFAKLAKDINKLADQEKRNLFKRQLTKAKKMAANLGGLDDCFARNITKKDGRYIVFCQDYEHLQEVKEQMETSLFSKVNPNVKFFVAYHKDSPKTIRNTIKEFNEDNSDALKVLLSIDMFNEGLHIGNVDGAILLRPTISPTIYYQQIGRALSTKGAEIPLIIDVVNNIISLHDIASVFSNDGKGGNGSVEDFQATLPFHIDEQALPLQMFLYHLQSLVTYRTTSSETYLAAAEEYMKNHENLKLTKGYEKNGVKLGKWLTHVRCSYNKNNRSVDPKISSKLLSLDPNVFTYTREASTSERNERYLEWVRQKQAENPNEPLPISINGKTITDEEKYFRNITAAIKMFINHPGTRANKFDQDFIDQILEINPRAYMTQSEKREERNASYLRWVQEKQENNPNQPLPTNTNNKNVSAEEIRFRLLTNNMKKTLKNPSKKMGVFTPAFVEQILAINPNALDEHDKKLESRNRLYLEWVKQQQQKNPNQPLPYKYKEAGIPKEEKFSRRMTLRIKMFTSNKEKSIYTFPEEFIQEIYKINPKAFDKKKSEQTAERDEKYIEWVKKQQKESPNKPLKVNYLSQEISEDEKFFRLMTKGIKRYLKNPTASPNKYWQDTIDKVLSINPHAFDSSRTKNKNGDE